LVAFLVAVVAANVAMAQVPPGKKMPVPPAGKAPVPPTGKAPVPPQKGPVAPAGKSPAAPSGNTKGPKLPETEDVSLETKDGLTIRATYYPGTGKKEAVPVIMIHDLGGQRGDFHGLGTYLQSLGHAAIAPDLRGHGQSKSQKGPTGAPYTLDSGKMNKLALEGMVYDVQACKKFLLDKNNAGDLNIEELCVVGAEFGATIAIRWTAMDWSATPLPAYKLGQDVKALVLLSPQPPQKGLGYLDVVGAIQDVPKLSWMIVTGSDDPKSSAEANKLHKRLVPHHPRTGEDTDLFLEEPGTTLAGTKLLGTDRDELGVKRKIGVFLEKRLVNHKADFAWQDRKGPGT
jgi:dienelactone hydrolase